MLSIDNWRYLSEGIFNLVDTTLVHEIWKFIFDGSLRKDYYIINLYILENIIKIKYLRHIKLC